MRTIFGSVADQVTSVLGIAKSKAPTSDHTTLESSTPTSANIVPEDASSRKSATRTPKRSRDEDETTMSSQRKRPFDSKRKFGTRLVPDYEEPSDATPLPRPGGAWAKDTGGKADSDHIVKSITARNSFKPRNTLYAAQPLRSEKQKDRMRGLGPQNKLLVQEVEGGNVNQRKGVVHLPKSSASSYFGRSPQMYDREAQQNRTLGSDVSQRHAEPSDRPPSQVDNNKARSLFNNSESRAVDQIAHTKSGLSATKRKRKRAEDAASSRSGRRSSYSLSRTSQDIEEPRVKDVSAISDGVGHSFETGDAATSIRRSSRSGVEQTRPTIDLTKGFDEISRSLPKRTRRGYRQASTQNDESPLVAQLLAASNDKHDSDSEHGDVSRRRHNTYNDGAVSPIGVHQDRDIRQYATPGRRVSPIADGADGADGTDPLTGPNTVGTTIRSATGQSQLRDDIAPRAGHSVSPSVTRQAKSKSNHSAKEWQAANQSRQTENNDSTFSEGNLSIPVKRLHCSLCNLTDGRIALEWDPTQNHFLVSRDGKKQFLPRKTRCITFGQGFRTWVYNEESPQVHVIGSRGPELAGNLLIEFCDIDDMEMCYEGLRVRSTTMGRKEVGKEWLASAFVKQAEAAYETAAKRNGTPLQLATHAPDEESIVYEDDSADIDQTQKTPRPRSSHNKASSRMQLEGQNLAESDEPATGYHASMRRSLRRSMPQARSTPEASPQPHYQKHSANLKPWQHPVLYPSLPSAPRRVTVDFKDLERLDEGEFLNDSIIGFALREIEEDMLRARRKDVYMFNTFFYSTLTTSKTGKRGFNYDAVKRWTNKVDLFGYQYVVVPINLNMHWFVAIICNLPALLNDSRCDTRTSTDEEDIAIPYDHAGTEAVKPDRQHSPDQDPPVPIGDLSIDDIDMQHEGIHVSQETTPKSVSKKGTTRNSGPAQKYRDTSDFFIMTLDSLGSARTTEIRYLQKYLIAEAEDKRKIDIDLKQFSGTTARGIPQQSNFCDCGVFLIAYIEAFARSPLTFVRNILRWRRDDDRDVMVLDPSGKRAELRDRLVELSTEQDKIRREARMKKIANKAAQRIASSQASAQDDNLTNRECPRADGSEGHPPHSSQDLGPDNHTPRRTQTELEEMVKVLPDTNEEIDLPVSPPHPATTAQALDAIPPSESSPPWSSSSDNDSLVGHD